METKCQKRGAGYTKKKFISLYCINVDYPISQEGGTLAHDGACITEFSKSMKTTFKYAGIATGCAGYVCERNLKKVFDDRCIL